MFRKIALLFILLFSLFSVYCSLFTPFVFADGEFTTDFDVTYRVGENGQTVVTNKIIITNIFSDLYATSYSLVLEGIKPEDIKAWENSHKNLNFESKIEENATSINVNFEDAVVGKNKSREFYIEYLTSEFAIKTGEVWEISIPKLSAEASFSSYFANLFIPKTFGEEAYISPNPISKSNDENYFLYKFSKTSLEKTGVVAGFGQFQVFSFSLNYHLENPISKTALTQVAIPPDSAFQKVYYENINPRPKILEIDNDGNWIATYELKSRERIDVTVTGFVQIFSGPRSFFTPDQNNLSKNLEQTNYWQVNDTKIREIAKIYKTPKSIYDFVSNTLKYDYERVKPNVDRLGAIEALNNPDSAICMEFTDLFIAISRANGIPAREVNGYAYTENPEIQPLSLVNDVLHSWPEYYDTEKRIWIPVDPTWGSTTNGVDYFNKLDLRHFAFVYHGEDDTKPYPPGSYKLGSNPQKDVYVSFAQLPSNRIAKTSIKAKLGGWIPFLPNRIEVNIKNEGPHALYSLTPNIYFDNKIVNTGSFIEYLLPYQEVKVFVDIPFSFLGSKTPDRVTVSILDQSVNVSTNKNQVVLYNLIVIFSLAIIIVLSVVFRVKQWKIRLPIFKKSKNSL